MSRSYIYMLNGAITAHQIHIFIIIKYGRYHATLWSVQPTYNNFQTQVQCLANVVLFKLLSNRERFRIDV